jgi:hypothetical protein
MPLTFTANNGLATSRAFFLMTHDHSMSHPASPTPSATTFRLQRDIFRAVILTQAPFNLNHGEQQFVPKQHHHQPILPWHVDTGIATLRLRNWHLGQNPSPDDRFLRKERSRILSTLETYVSASLRPLVHNARFDNSGFRVP